MSRYRKQLLFLCDTLLLVGITWFFVMFGAHHTVLIDAYTMEHLPANLVLLYLCVTLSQMLFHTYDSLWRYAESREYLILLAAVGTGFLAYEIISRMIVHVVISVLLLTCIAAMWVLGMLTLRFTYRTYRKYSNYMQGKTRVPIAVVGAGEAGVQLMEELRTNPSSRYQVECFFDDDVQKIGKRIHGVEVRGTIEDVPLKLGATDIREVVVAIPTVSEGRRQEILRQLSVLHGIRVSVLPSTTELIERKPIQQQVRQVRIEDLLGREPVQLDPAPVDDFLGGKTVLVTGGGGSIGSELCRQIVKHHPKRLVILDIYENNAYDIQQELLYQYGKALNLSVEIASIRDAERLRQVFDRYRPEVVFHAAAHKHVPLMENSPQEAIRNNVFGTLHLVNAAEEFGVSKFIQISTDKAVNPTSVMGASKRMCEMILQSRKGCSKTTFAAVRFGNVLGSNGSVVPLFKRQIAAGGPVTITDKRIIRYFMTIPEAAQLVLQAGAMARQNELYVLDMGQPVKILDLAENLIRLSGHVPYKDIDIVETGLRPGEKLYEELLVGSRDIEKTDNDMIFVERQPGITREELTEKLAILTTALSKKDPTVIRKALHEAVPDFREPEELNRGQGAEVQIPTGDPHITER